MTKDFFFQLRLVYFALEREKNSYFEKENLTASQGDILLFLAGAKWRGNEVNQKDIETHFRLTNPTVTGLLNRLEEKGFVVRVKSEVDARQKYIHLTKNGISVLKRFKNHKEFLDEKIFKGFKKEDKADMLDKMHVILENLKNE
ncbi:DNA-binding transcriptional regulator, MarR family [Amphibacillus marinus]|uniref:DNA-binding transcriptional regulator, MarR family n=1 Tax=Amphibacillus marinus TaxID=872970 RepID=A0A1H8RCF3_9BACI|nr:MarR family transcriptional regulator [Amphibacillus marinus]SEO64081.1 DNA-binding transcriptional regulator, MarR family [Amphibacillus marinus]